MAHVRNYAYAEPPALTVPMGHTFGFALVVYRSRWVLDPDYQAARHVVPPTHPDAALLRDDTVTVWMVFDDGDVEVQLENVSRDEGVRWRVTVPAAANTLGRGRHRMQVEVRLANGRIERVPFEKVDGVSSNTLVII